MNIFEVSYKNIVAKIILLVNKLIQYDNFHLIYNKLLFKKKITEFQISVLVFLTWSIFFLYHFKSSIFIYYKRDLINCMKIF